MVRLARFSASDDGPIDHTLGWDRGFDTDEEAIESIDQKPRRPKKRSKSIPADDLDAEDSSDDSDIDLAA